MNTNKGPDFKNPECGATAIEYGLIAALIAVAALAALTAIGGSSKAFNAIKMALGLG